MSLDAGRIPVYSLPVSDVVPIGRLLAAARTIRGFSQREVARRAGTSAVYLSRVERGRRNPSPEMVRRLVIAIDTNGEPPQEAA